MPFYSMPFYRYAFKQYLQSVGLKNNNNHKKKLFYSSISIEKLNRYSKWPPFWLSIGHWQYVKIYFDFDNGAICQLQKQQNMSTLAFEPFGYFFENLLAISQIRKSCRSNEPYFRSFGPKMSILAFCSKKSDWNELPLILFLKD